MTQERSEHGIESVAARFQRADSARADSNGTLETCRHVPVVGLIGGIGSGKSAVAAEFARRGAAVISGDLAGHEALRQPEIRDVLVKRWGDQVLDERGEIDRKKVAAIVFGDPGERKALEALVHPEIRRRLKEQIALARTRPDVPLIVLDAAVLLEAGWDALCDRIVFVETGEAVRRERVQQRGWRLEQMAQREAAQLPLTQKRCRADHVLDNSSTLDHLGRQVAGLMQIWGLSPAAPASTTACHDGGPGAHALMS
jgi:dephospho-CoA kinase